MEPRQSRREQYVHYSTGEQEQEENEGELATDQRSEQREEANRPRWVRGIDE